ncbi:hypothetical protein OH76DRAFT_460313 [Lentinus brumalis]|uniref:F-box domain-containing protein n=1 Tax=Lentinus brumalis TaxID=2498619 RepID=A0A371CIG8_9APHY|nr:hypothetical protein OH76DRAFT_460313 [Polyporus brumalis]
MEVIRFKREQWLRERNVVLARQAALEQELAELNRLLNTTVPVNALPDELLVQIFAFFRAAVDREWQLAGEWMKIQGVCRRWRQIAISTPMFWRAIKVYKKREWLSLSLLRSARTSVDITFLHPSFPPTAAMVLLSHASRIRRLVIQSANAAWNAVLIKLFSFPTPSLEILRVLQRNAHDDLGIRGDRLPGLKDLALERYVVPGDKTLFANLRTLVLDSCIFGASWPQPFLNLLKTAGHLEKLTLKKCLTSSAGLYLEAPRAERVVLTSLRTFRISGDSSSMTAAFLNSLQVPNISHAEIECDTFANDTFRVTDTIASALPADVKAVLPMWTAVNSVRVTAEDDYFEVLARTAAGQTIHVSLMSSLSTLLWGSSFGRLIADCARLFANSPIRHLDLEGNHALVGVDTWRDVFGQFTELETLTLCGSHCGSLDTLWKGLASAPDGHICCPRLARIATEEGMEICFSDFLLGSLFETLRKRQAGGARLGLLDVRLQRYGDHGVRLEEHTRALITHQLKTMVDRVSIILLG